ncbi:Hypothetical protein RG1141_CH01760 [Neorhizobium galegae bv. officinalis bv. officinalis str. HAMBI 1141]|uniref:Uncharacterized protein n=1 Tax=Neorhizobium galegae bv. officinalis bv. officinalis str. HAMBI 1141 TaxID=1028801 RepID=A0A068T3D3_NEOGA|nr:hypothetical protein [Neorhizobium galegae]CDN52541.1 Hypothetical protein RG1141_CH01760 [Neorhizobium galegae bv. officinalis bv. officinalis str. HAMBI 1141]
MSRYSSVPTLNPAIMMPGKVTFDTPGGSVDGGRNGLGDGISINLTGGPIVTATMENCFIHEPEQFEYMGWLRARLNSGVRFVNVPLLTDWYGPFPIIDGVPTPTVEGIPHSDGSYFGDGAGYSQATVWGKVTEDAGQYAGILRLRIYNASRPLRHNDWFSIYHETKGWRAYSYWDVLERYDDGIETIVGTPSPYQEYRLALDIPLREAVTAGMRAEFARPRCVMKFPVGFSLPTEIEGFYEYRPTLRFTEGK